jgi:hypothetical protein
MTRLKSTALSSTSGKLARQADMYNATRMEHVPPGDDILWPGGSMTTHRLELRVICIVIKEDCLSTLVTLSCGIVIRELTDGHDEEEV